MAFILSWLILQLPFFHSTPKESIKTVSGAILVETTKPVFSHGETVILQIKTLSGTSLAEFPSTFPKQPFIVKKEGKIIEDTTTYKYTEPKIVATDKQAAIISYEPWNAKLFAVPGKYSIEVPYQNSTYITEFEVAGENAFSWVWSTLFIKPIYNLLVYFAFLLGNQLIWGIILITVLVRLILLVPSQKAMESQRAMQLVQPKLKEIQEKYKGDQKKISMETMRIMKEHKVNPLGGCLPILLQIPILLAIYTVVQNVLSLSFTVNLYDILGTVNIQNISSNVLNIFDLAKPEMFVLPLIVAGLQYYQIDLSMKKVKGIAKAKKDPNMPDPEMMQKWMKFGLPVLIWFMSITLPSGVSIYWAVSTLFSIAQQYIVNKEPIIL